ncbi:MAG: hypothetical protein KY476_24765 [Planctomycetes bacterium]|nr:hypothetical protein [Planctomycetota bacterium]
MNAKMLGSGVLVGLGLGLFIVPSDARSQPAVKPPRTNVISLQRQRRDVLEQLVGALEARYRAGNASFEALLHARKRALQADLELAVDPQRRIDLRRKQVQILKSLHEEARQRVEIGTEGMHLMLEAEAALLEAEIELLREQSQNGKPQ